MGNLSILRGALASAQVSAYTTGTITLPSARTAFVPPTAFESIATGTPGAGGGAAEIVFTSIPQTYEYLQVRIFLRTDNSSPLLRFRLNADYGSQYSYARMMGFEGIFGQSYDAGTYDSGTDAEFNYQVANNTSPNLIGTRVAIIDVYDYANTSKFTGMRSVFGAHGSAASTPGVTGINYSQYSETTAITSITLRTGNGFAFDSDSYAALYGIKGS